MSGIRRGPKSCLNCAKTSSRAPAHPMIRCLSSPTAVIRTPPSRNTEERKSYCACVVSWNSSRKTKGYVIRMALRSCGFVRTASSASRFKQVKVRVGCAPPSRSSHHRLNANCTPVFGALVPAGSRCVPTVRGSKVVPPSPATSSLQGAGALSRTWSRKLSISRFLGRMTSYGLVGRQGSGTAAENRSTRLFVNASNVNETNRRDSGSVHRDWTRRARFSAASRLKLIASIL